MVPQVGDGWVPTERTHPATILLFVFVFPVIGAGVLYFSTLGIIHLLGPRVAIVVATGFVSVLAASEIWFWLMVQPISIRVASSGIEVRTRRAPVFIYPSDTVVLQASYPATFGLVNYRGRERSVFLSPNQFTAARQFYSVAPARVGRPARA